RSSYAGSNVLF
nr:immunoglobulin light chain junction region [Macaca mulatta]